MRKAYKKKLRSCAMCKSHKMNGSVRWKPRTFAKLREDEREIREARQ